MTKIIDKIKKLLALSDSSNEHEAQRAMEIAQKVMAEYNVEMNQVENRDKKEYIAKEYGNAFSRSSMEDKFIHDILNRFFYIDIVKNQLGYKKFQLVFVGESNNVETAIFVKNFLKTTFKKLWNKFKKENNLPNNMKQSFYAGLWRGISETLQKQKEDFEAQQEEGLVLAKDPNIKKKIDEVFGMKNLKKQGRKSINIKDSNSAKMGYEEGRKVQIGRGLNQNRDNSSPKQIEAGRRFW